jgi:uncharacterized protein YecE (DUF72 family)
MNPTLRIGTSGWHYGDWKKRFYPEKMPPAEYLDFYSRSFDTVELNGVFYRLPTPDAVKNWYREAPKGFIFAYKASRFLTHMKKLKDPQQPLRLMFRRADLLKEKLGPILYQLPPFWDLNMERLETFLKALPKGYDHVMEFRNPTWFTDDVYERLERYRVTLCFYDMQGKPSPERLTSKLVFVRMHGSEGKYSGSYPEDALQKLGQKIHRWRADKRSVFVYFNNDPQAHAIQNATELKRISKMRE